MAFTAETRRRGETQRRPGKLKKTREIRREDRREAENAMHVGDEFVPWRPSSCAK
jgi:hypothetical protein